MRSGPELPLKTQITIAVVCTALFLWVLPAITTWLKNRMESRPTVHALALWIRCEREPAEFEHIVVLIRAEGKGHTGECIYVTSRGAYGVTR